MTEDKFKINIWQVSAIILFITVTILLYFVFIDGANKMSGKAISADEAGKQLVNYLNTKTNGGVELVSSSDKGYIYEVKVKYQGQEIPVYTTKDGKYFVQGATPITEEPVMQKDVSNSNTNTNAPQGVSKSDKPIVEAFVFSYCPYGLQFEKALFPAYDLLKDKVDFRIVAIGAMHGDFEKTESLRQISIEKLYGKDKLFSYLKEFDKNSEIGSCRGDESCLDKYLPNIYKKLSIDKAKIENYMKSDAEKIYNEQNARANNLGVSGSPTFVINSAQVQVNRSPDSIKEAVCEAFNTKPNECSQSLSTQSESPGFG
ncbi:MAG: thioredoxin domain-containing protein [Nanoarchaeota archaeon]|nr:thioredoxin domain-containing protein [Nanoarchaeota archaeon]